MTDWSRSDSASRGPVPRDLDRLRELANIGAGHAATALSRLTGRPVWMRVPRMTRPTDEAPAASETPQPAIDRSDIGVLFSLSGCLDAQVAILFSAEECRSVVCALIKDRPRFDAAEAESAVAEAGNILVSHAASAIADTLGDRLLPSIPVLAMRNADRELSKRVGQRRAGRRIRIECELSDGCGKFGGLLVVVPDGPAA